MVDSFPKNRLAWVRSQASFILKGERVKANICVLVPVSLWGHVSLPPSCSRSQVSLVRLLVTWEAGCPRMGQVVQYLHPLQGKLSVLTAEPSGKSCAMCDLSLQAHPFSHWLRIQRCLPIALWSFLAFWTNLFHVFGFIFMEKKNLLVFYLEKNMFYID